MASLSLDSGKFYRIQFVHPNGHKHSLRLGALALGRVKAIKVQVEQMVAALKAGVPFEPALQQWIEGLSQELYDRLAKVELVPARTAPIVVTLKGFLDGFIARRTDVKPATREIWRQTARCLMEHFGKDCDIAAITEATALDFKQYLIDEKLAPTTVAKRLQTVRSFFHDARRRKVIPANPFAEVSAKSVIRLDGRRYVTLDETAKILAACPSHHWRTITALCRYAGLRCPSEVLSLRWQDVDWDNERVVVQSPKTECHGKPTRTIPLFPELLPILREAFELADEGANFVVEERFRRSATNRNGWRNCNLRTTFEKIIKRAGLTPWPKLFHALRSSCETDLAGKHPIHVVTAWLGNTPTIALRHYLLVTEADFQRATAKEPKNEVALIPALQGEETARGGSQAETADACFAGENDALPVGAKVENWGTRIRT